MWNKIEESSSEDETLGNSFFTNGLFKISNEEQSTKNPRINAALQNNKITISVDKSLILLEDESAFDFRFLSFSAEIQAVAVSRSGELIVCCLADGNIHGVHIKGIPVFNMIIQDEDVHESQSFLDVKQINDEFYIMCANGAVYKLHDIDEQLMSEMIANSNVDDTCVFNETVLKTAVLDKVANVKLPKELFSFCCIHTFSGEVFVVSGSESVYFVSNDYVDRIGYPQNIGKIKNIYNLENFVLGLTETGQFVEICPYTKTLRLIIDGNPQEMVEDLRVLEANDDYIELLVLSTVNQNSRAMKILDFPSMTTKSELSLPAISWLVSQQKSSVNMFFIAGVNNENNFTQTIEIRSITETDPEQRFKKLLLRGHFDEAETFAKEYELSLEPLHQARVKKSLMNLVNIKPHSPAFEETFTHLMSQLTAVEDKNFLVTLHLQEIPDRTSMTTFLEHLLANIDTNQHQNETNEINELLLRLETLRLIDPDECNMQWMKFLYHSDMARVAMDQFKSDVLLSCLVWSRHSSSIIPKLNLEQFHKWLGRIPTTIEPFQLIQWLKHFSPCFLQAYPNEMTPLIHWCLERTRGLQYSNAWPEIGLEFISNINGIFSDMKFMFVDIRRLYHNNIEKIQQMIFTLEEMAVLKKSYHLTMTLDDYSKGSIEDTAFRLLQRIQMHNLKRMVNDFLYPIFMEQGITPEDTIVKYVEFLCNNKNLGYWQERAVTAIDLLSNEENRLNSALLVLKVSPVPWNDVVLPLAKLGVTSNHPVAQLIYVEFKTQAIKMIKMKYQWPVDYFDLQHDRMKLVSRILKVNGPEMIEDVKTLVKSSPDIAHEAYDSLMLRLVKLGKIDELMELVVEIEENLDMHRILFEAFINGCVKMIDENYVDEVENTMEAIKLLVNRLKPSWDSYVVEFHDQRVKNLKNILKIRAEFKLNIQLKNLKSGAERLRMMEEGIALVAVFARQKSSIVEVFSKVDLLTKTFGFDRIFGYKLLCKSLNNIYITCYVVDVLSSSVEVVEKQEIESCLELVVIMISQQIAYFENNLAANFDNYDPLTFPLAFKLLSKCQAHHDLVRHSSVMKLLTWMRIGKNFYPFDVIKATKTTRVVDEKVFSSKMANGGHHMLQNGSRRESFSIFDAVETKVEVKQQQQINENLNPVLRTVCNSLKVLINATDMASEPYSRFRSHLEAASDSQQIKNDFFATLENLLRIKQYKPAIKIIQLVVEQQIASKTAIIPPMFVTNVNKKILKFALSQKEPDYMDAFRILRAEINRDECLDYLRSILKNNSQKIAFATFSEMYNNYIGNSDCVQDERQNRLKFYYYSELCKYDQSLRFKTNFDNFSISDLLKDLENRQLNVELVKKLSKDFGWDYQKALVQQIKILLRHQELDFEVKTDVFGKDEVVVKSSVELIRKKCDSYLNEITNLQLLATELISFIKDINYYFYEMYLVVLELIEYSQDLSIEQKVFRNVLLLLKHQLTGKRRGTEQIEVDYWMKLQPENSVLPGIAKYRLPFKPMMEETPETFLNEELNVDTFEKCIPLITLHASFGSTTSEERLEICGFQAVKNSVMDLKAKNETKNGNEWNLKPTNNAFLQTILRMVSLLNDKSKRMAILYFHVNHTPQGSDQVEAAYEAWKFATANQKELLESSKYVELVDRIKRKYPLLKTQHLLHLYGLNDDKLMQLVENPLELINALYHHDSILQPQKKDINKLCDELAQLYGIDLMTLQNKLVHKWLAFVGNSSFEDAGDANETVYEDFIGSPAPVENAEFISDESVIRAHFILSSWKSDVAMDFLASELSSSSANPENQLQLYECFAKLIDNHSESYMELINPNDFLLIKCCHFLKSLGLNYKPEKFKDMEKVEILKRVWTSHYNNSKGLEVMSFICLGFDIHLPQIWNGILKQMVAMKMIAHLSILVEILSTKSKLLHLSSLKLAWECVIKEPFLHATKVRSYDQENNLAKSLILLQKCPISTFLDFENLVELCLRLERPHMAAIFVAFVSEKSREKFVKVLDTFDKREMKKEIVELEEMGVAPVVTKSVTNILKL